jgi:hypothetical protein
LRDGGSIVLFRWRCTYVVEHRLIEGSSRWGDTDLHLRLLVVLLLILVAGCNRVQRLSLVCPRPK